MKASFYQPTEPTHPLLEKLSEHVLGEISPDDTAASLEWLGEESEEEDGDEDVLFLVAINEDLGIELDDHQIESFMAGEMKVAELLEIGLSKEARLSTPEEKNRARLYRLQNAMALKRKAKKRRRLIKQGLKRPQKRLGSGAGGYTFIPSAGGSVGHVVAMTGGVGSSSVGKMNFSPHASPSPSIMHTQSLNKMATVITNGVPMPTDVQQAAAFNPQNPIAGLAGFPKAPPKVSVVAPQVKTPKPKRPVNFRKVLPAPMPQAIKGA